MWVPVPLLGEFPFVHEDFYTFKVGAVKIPDLENVSIWELSLLQNLPTGGVWIWSRCRPGCIIG
jgi:hypothetical protein